MRHGRRCTVAWLSFVTLALVGLTAAPASRAANEPTIPFTWGANGFGQLGDGTQTARSTPAAVPTLSDVTDLHSGREHVVAVISGSTVVAWGSNVQGQLGIGGGADRASPTVVPGLSGITAVSTGHYHSMALTEGGRIWAWGLNASGQLGDGTRTIRASPVLVAGINDAVAIAAGRDMSYAVRADGTVWAWGLNGNGQLGDGTTTDRSTPVQVKALTGVVSVSGGRDHGLAVRDDGSAWAWGWNAYGQVGDGTLTDRLTPVQVIDSGVEAVAGGAHHSYALKVDGTVTSWGRNYRAELGDGTTTNRVRPVQVLDVAGAVSVGSGRDHGIVVLADGTAKTWGSNGSGQLGDGTIINRSRAVLVPGITGASEVGGGGEGHTVVLVASDAPSDHPPTAFFTADCQALSCVFDGTGSSDPEGSVSHAWDFDDASTSRDVVAEHTYAAAGTYAVSLTVTDSSGQSSALAREVTVTATPSASVTFRAAASINTRTRRPTIRIPATVQAGDVLVLFATTNRNANLTPPAGWTSMGARLDGSDLESWAFTRVAPVGAAGATVTMSLDDYSQVSSTLLAYAGAGPVQASASTGESVYTRTHRSPPVAVAGTGSWVVSHWVDRTGGHAGWTLPASVTPRNANAGAGTGRLSAVTGDTGPVAPGTWPGVTATSGVASSKAISWSVIVPVA